MGTISRTTISPGDNIDAEPLDNNFSTIYSEFNGSIEDVNVASDAAITWSKISKTNSVIDDIGDVSASSPTAGEQLHWDGSNWSNSGLSWDDWVSESDGATITFDISNGQRQTVTLGGNRTIAFSNFNNGQVVVLELVQDGTGSRTVTWPSAVKWPGGNAPTLSTGANAVDTIVFIKKDSSNIYGFTLGLDLN